MQNKHKVVNLFHWQRSRDDESAMHQVGRSTTPSPPLLPVCNYVIIVFLLMKEIVPLDPTIHTIYIVFFLNRNNTKHKKRKPEHEEEFEREV